MPESRLKYLYERLGDHDFQLLTNALLTYRFPDFIPLPLRQSDGGRDGVIQGGPDKLIYQVKWSVKGTEKKPVDWLDAVVKSESRNLKRLASEGSRRYVLVTNVPSTGAPGSGTFDRLNERLDEHAKAFGFEQMSCFWGEAVDGMVDGAPREVKWAYAEMLAGWDLIRYLMDEDGHPGKDAHLRKLLRRVAAAQWDDDELVKFSQVDIDREKVADLFIDVHADRLRQDSRDPQRIRSDPLGGAAAYLLSDEPRPAKHDFTLVRGVRARGSRRCRSTSHRSTAARLSPNRCARKICPFTRDQGSRCDWTSATTPVGWQASTSGTQRLTSRRGPRHAPARAPRSKRSSPPSWHTPLAA